MSNPTQKNPVPEVIPAKCPYCGKYMNTIDGYPYTLGSFAILSIKCSNVQCHKLLHMQIFQTPAPATDPETPKGPELWKPS